MTKNPFLNALSAAGYILLVVGVMDYISRTSSDKPDTILAPIIVLSMLTLSAAVMAYLFFYQPIRLLTENKKKEAVDFFSKTLGAFAVFTLLVLLVMFSGLV